MPRNPNEGRTQTMSDILPDTFRAFRISDDEQGYRGELVEQSIDEQSDGDVVIKVAYSSVNYKDALAGTGKGKILRRFPLNGGIDAAGTVVRSDSADFAEGDEVLITGSGLSETRDGGYSEYLRAPSEWLVPLPEGLTLHESMILGTAGFTAALGLWRMEANGQRPDMGPIAITGASGGVGSLALDIYSRAGYEVTAISGKEDEFEWLHELGASQCISRHELYWPETALASARFAGALDNVGGDMLSGLTRVIQPWGNIAACGMAGGIGLNTTVMPFIIRGIGLLGINSAGCPYAIRRELWERLAADWRPRHLGRIAGPAVDLQGLGTAFEHLLAGEARGRTVVEVSQ
jgi:putative YhdH/YhfP family quinone oxidoreductase